MRSIDVLDQLADLFLARGVPDHIRSDNGSEFTAALVRAWLSRLGVRTLFIEPGSPWENGYVESFNGRFRDELLDREIFYTMAEAKVLIERWRREYNTIRPHGSLGYRPPAPEAVMIWPPASASLQPAASRLGLTWRVVRQPGAGHFSAAAMTVSTRGEARARALAGRIE